jgi:DNA invertase Pin-like site-specific DNA recombinase
MNVGYIRVSTEEQNTVRQEVLMKDLGVEKVFIEKISGANRERKQLKAMLDFVREGDTVIVESMSRLSRSALDFLNIANELKEKKVVLVSKKENIDTETAQGKFMLTVFAGLAELERESLKQRQLEGIKEAKKAGKYKGRQPIKTDKKKFETVYSTWKSGQITAVQAQKELNLKPNTFYRMVKKHEGLFNS